jgi:hypothetical protein
MQNDKWKIVSPAACLLLLLPPSATGARFRLSFAEASGISYTSGLPTAPGSHFSLVAVSGARLAAFFEGGVYVRPC